MCGKRRGQPALCCVFTGAALGILVGCEQPGNKPDAAQSRPAPTTSDANEPSAVEPNTPTTTAPAEPVLPAYLKLLERFDPQQPARVSVVDVSDHRLVIDTLNVRRLHIDRSKLPFTVRRSVVLVLDRQGIEWRVSSSASEFVRSTNGAWSAAAPTTNEAPADE